MGKVFKSDTKLLTLDPIWYLELCPEVRRATFGSSVKSQVLDLKTFQVH